MAAAQGIELPGADLAAARTEPRVSAALGAVPPAYFEEAVEVAERAFGPESIERSYRVGGLDCRVRYASPAVEAAIHRALAHLERPARSAAELSIHVWDSARAEEALPEPHEIMLLYYRNHCLALCSDARYLALDERWLAAKSFIDRERGEAWYCLEGIERLPYYQRAAPLRSVLNALFGPRRRHLIHAAALGTPAGGVLLPGPSGVGKSSTALSCLGGSLGYLADDWCGLWESDEPRIFSVYGSAKLCTDNVGRFPELRERVQGYDTMDREKATLFLGEHWPGALLAECAARAILLPELAGGERTEIEPAPRRQAWQALLESTLSQLPGCEPNSAAELITRTCARLPAYRLKLGTDRDGVREAVETFMASS
ncbi:MAG TPA: hypothetical protein VGK73_19235 [Polyangiaceae bacterium]